MMFATFTKLVGSLRGFPFDADEEDDEPDVATLEAVTPGLATALEGRGYTHVEDVREASPRELASACPMSYVVAMQIHADATDSHPMATIYHVADHAAAHERDEPLRFDDSAAVDVWRWR